MEFESGKLWFDDFSVEIFFIDNFEKDLHTVGRQFTRKLNFVVFEVAFGAKEWGNDDFPEKRNFGKQNSCLAIVLTVHAKALGDDGLRILFDVDEDWLWVLFLLHFGYFYPTAGRTRFIGGWRCDNIENLS